MQFPQVYADGVSAMRAFDKVGEAGEAAPNDGGAWWRIGAATETAPGPRDAPDMEIEVARELLLAFRRPALEQLAFDTEEIAPLLSISTKAA